MKLSVYLSTVRKFRGKLRNTPKVFARKRREKIAKELSDFISKNRESAYAEWEDNA